MSYDKRLRQVLITSANNGAGDNLIVTGAQMGAGQGSIKVWQILLNSSGANVITPKSGSTVIGGQIVHTAAGSSTTEQNTETPWIECKPGQNLVLNFTAGNTTTGTLWYSLA
jgi:hypothetical protein